jgi:cation-transporting ATPase 13A3/4/5
MLTLTVIALINVVLILRPPRFLSVLLELMALPLLARLTLLSAVVVNVVLSVMFEHWGAELVAGAVRFVASFIQDVKRTRESRQYKMIDSEPR